MRATAALTRGAWFCLGFAVTLATGVALGLGPARGLAAETPVTIRDFAFAPPVLVAPTGTTVRWTNQDGAAHTTTSDTGVWDSGTLAGGQSFPHTFAQAGVFAYHCAIHPGMTGALVVAAPAGATEGATAWYFAEGYTGPGFDEYLTILNPNAGPAAVAVIYYLASGPPEVKTLTVDATTRSTVAVHETGQGVGRDKEVSAQVVSTNGVGIIVERPIYFRYTGATISDVTGGHNVMGATAPKTAWYFAEGFTGTGFDEYLTILNPNGTSAPVTITYYLSDGTTRTETLIVAAAARRTVVVHGASEGVGRNREVAAKVTTTNTGGIVVERPMYFVYNGSVTGVTGGHNVMGFAP
jgi:plastocyanin